jgi:hypothetical protein
MGGAAREVPDPARPLRFFARILLGGALAACLAVLLGPFAPWLLPDEPTLVPRDGQSRIHTVLVATWWAAAVNAVLCALLLATSRAWARPARGPLAGMTPIRVGGAALAAFAVAAALAGALRWPLVTGSLWWDEAWSVRYTVVGKVEPGSAAGETEFRPAPWIDTLWYYRTPTNHAAYSVAARATNGAWRALAGAAPQAFDERAFRLPAWLAAIAAVVAMGFLVHALGFPAAAPAAAFLLAIHPWHVRYGADGRGYSFVVLFGTIASVCLLRALREDRWRYWLGAAAAHALLLWSLPIAVYLPLATVGAAAVAIAAGPREARGRLVRLGVAHVVAAMAYLQVMAPNLAQAMRLDRLLGEEAKLDGRLAWNLFVAATTGLPVRMPRVPDVAFPTLESASLALQIAVAAAIPALLAVGAVRVLRRDAAARAVASGLVAAPFLLMLHRAVDGFFLYPRFAIYALIPATALLAIGFEGMIRAAAPAPARARWLVPAGLAAGLVAFQLAVAPQTRVLLRYPQEPAREVARFVRGAAPEHPEGAIGVGVGLGGDVPRVYDPWIVEVEEPAALVAELARARAEARPLYAFYGHAALNRKRFPATLALVDDRSLFEPVARFDGIEAEHVYRVFRYTGVAPPEAARPTGSPAGRSAR